MRSRAEELALADPETRARVLDGLEPEQLRHLLTDWHFLRRPDQALPTGPWRTVLVMAGRGWGKSRFGAESVNELVMEHGYKRIGFIGRTSADVRDVMTHGPSGVLNVGPPEYRLKHYPSKRLLRWPNGAEALTFSADKPDQLRGPQYDLVWGDEVLGLPIRKVVIPVAAGRNIAVLTEAAVRSTVLQLRGVDTMRDFVERQHRMIQQSGS